MRGWKGRGEEINDGTGDTDITCAPLTRSCEVSDRVLYFHCGMFDGSWEERLSPGEANCSNFSRMSLLFGVM